MEEIKNARLSDDFLEELGDKAKKTKTTEKKHVKSDVIERSSLQDDGENFSLMVHTIRVSFIGGGNRSIRRKPPTCHKSLTNFIT
jgi:hypothetical protein